MNDARAGAFGNVWGSGEQGAGAAGRGGLYPFPAKHSTHARERKWVHSKFPIALRAGEAQQGASAGYIVRSLFEILSGLNTDQPGPGPPGRRHVSQFELCWATAGALANGADEIYSKLCCGIRSSDMV